MQLWMIDIINHFGYLGISLLIALENIFPPIPSEIVLAFGGFLTTQSDLNIWLVALFATVGSTIGAIALYGIGYLLTKQRFIWLIDMRGHILGIKSQDIKRAEHWFYRKGGLTVFFCRFVPIVRSIISLPAGMSHMPLGKFLLYTIAGTAVWNAVLIHLGALAGSNWQAIIKKMDTYAQISFVVLLLLAIGGAGWLFCKKRKR